MDTSGPRTRSRARTGVNSVEISKQLPISKPAPVDANPTPIATKDAAPSVGELTRHESLIPAYKYEDKIEDVSLETLMGTPFTCEVKKRRQTTEDQDVVKESSVEEEAEEEASLEAPATKSPVAPPANVDQPATTENVEEEEVFEEAEEEEEYDEEEYYEEEYYDESLEGELASAFEGMGLGEDATLLSGPLRGLPASSGSHIRFDDDDKASSSPRQRIFLRGYPEPTGKHTTFDHDDGDKEN